MTTEEIRKELKTIRLYYADKAKMDAAFQVLPHKTANLVRSYAEVIRDAPLDLYRIYFELYVMGLTQEAAAEELNYSCEYVRMKTRNFWSISERIYQKGGKRHDKQMLCAAEGTVTDKDGQNKFYLKGGDVIGRDRGQKKPTRHKSLCRGQARY